MQSEEIRKRFLAFFKEQNHSIIPSMSLVPENDPTVLFITAGMQPLIPYLRGESHPAGKRLANIQKCVRTQDIEEVGDATHDTFFEMMGNWSLGDYFKKEAILWSYKLLTDPEKGFGLDPNRLYVTVYAGDENIPVDKEASEIWQSAGIPENRIYYLGANANWWPNVKGRDNWTGPTGPSTEMFYDITEDGLGNLSHEEFIQADDEQKIVEIWNDVFMAYDKKDGTIVGDLTHKNVDTGAGLERLAMVLQKKNNIFDTDLFAELMAKINKLTTSTDIKAKRIVADHIRTAVFMISDGVLPANTDRGYILRRLLRRAVRYSDILKISSGELGSLSNIVINKYGNIYPNLIEKSNEIVSAIDEEETRFRKTLDKGMKEFEKMLKNGNLSGVDAFTLFTSFGFPFELTKELVEERGLIINEEEYRKEMEKHRDLSRAGADQKFKGGLADTSEESIKLHTATHLLHQALRSVLGPHVEQKGSNITPERLRFDFTHGDKITDEQKKAVEDIVNQKISENLLVQHITLPIKDAEKTGALHFFGEKYGEKVNVYFIGDSLESAFSKEYCGGPHVERTSELGKFTITKEESVAKGIRRIKAILQ